MKCMTHLVRLHKYSTRPINTWGGQAFSRKRKRINENSVNAVLSIEAICILIEMTPQNCHTVFSLHTWVTLYENVHGLQSNQQKFNHLFLCRRAKLLQSELLNPSTPPFYSVHVVWQFCTSFIPFSVAYFGLETATHKLEHGFSEDLVNPFFVHVLCL